MGTLQLPHGVAHVACMVLALVLLAPSSFAASQLLSESHMMVPPTHTRSYTAEAEADRVTSLPGAPADLDFGMFSGYVTVDESAGRALFYVFAESRTAPQDAPLLLWLNGGPGCSSLGGGFMSELGPFYPKADGRSLQANPYSWNNVANVLWLESPAFVGFSYSNSTADAIVGDARTAADARLFLLHWVKRFPQYAHSDLYLSGESYGGHYVPNLALEIVKGNKRAPSAAAVAAAAAGDSSSSSSGRQGLEEGVSPGKGFLNLKGFFVGNAWTDAAIDNRGALDFWYSHAMIGAESYHAVAENCDFSDIGPLMRGAEALSLPNTHRRSDTAAATAATAAKLARLLKQQQQQQQQQQQPAATAATAATAAASDVEQGLIRRSSSGLGHSRLPGWQGFGSSSTTRFWEAEGLGSAGFSLDDTNNIICARWLDIAQAELGNINIYEIYADVCVASPGTSNTDSSSSGSSSSSQPRYMGALLGHNTPRKRVAGGIGEGPDDDGASEDGGQPRRPRYDPCIDGEVETYLNLPEVQFALHANQSYKLPWRWTDCTSLISYSREDLLSSMLPVYKQLLDAKPALKMWVFSGDVDGIVPVLGSRRWIESLQLPVVKPWRSWTSKTGQVGGWRIDYDGITFATVRNSGHMVPYVTPERAFHLLGHFLFGDQAKSKAAASSSSTSSSSRPEISKR